MIEILNFKPINKGFLVGSVNIRITKWDFILNKVNIFNKDGKRWISLPQECYEEHGQKKYFPLAKFGKLETMNKFQETVLLELDVWMQKNQPSESPQSSVNNELPF